jgi:hypothetical protein
LSDNYIWVICFEPLKFNRIFLIGVRLILKVYNRKYRFRTIWLLAAVLLTGFCQRAGAVSKGLPTPKPIRRPQPIVKTAGETPEAAVAIASACKKIMSGDFEGAGEVIEGSGISQSKGLEQLGVIVAEYEAVKVGRKTSKNDAYTEQIDELDKLQQESPPEDVNDINQVFLTIVKASEHADENKKKALLEEPPSTCPRVRSTG